MSISETEQQETIDFLTAALSENDTPPKIITTHISVVFLSGDRVIKLKRAVKFPFLDFRTLEARHEACRREVEINRRTAPTIYKGVLPVTLSSGGLELDGRGEAVDWVVDMRRFDESLLFDRLAAVDNGLRRPVIEDLADAIAEFHEKADIRGNKGGAGGILSLIHI